MHTTCDSPVSPSRSLVEFPLEERHDIFRHHSALRVAAHVCDRAYLFEVRRLDSSYVRKFFTRGVDHRREFETAATRLSRTIVVLET